MNEKDLRETIQALKATRIAATQSKETAIAYLQKLGMVDENRELSERYRQPYLGVIAPR